MGRSRGGLTTKIHALVDALGNPIKLHLTAGQAHDSVAAGTLLDALDRDHVLLADRAYDNDAIRDRLMASGSWANIPPKRNRKRPAYFNPETYKKRNLVERFFNKIKHYRGIATRYDKRPDTFLAAVKLLATRVWLRHYESTA